MIEDQYLNLLLIDYILDKKIKSIHTINIYKGFLKLLIRYYNIDYKQLYKSEINININNYQYFLNYGSKTYKNFAKYVYYKYIL